MVGCSNKEKIEEVDAAKVELAGVYKGSADGYNGEINVEVTLDDKGAITKIKVDENHTETENIAIVPIENIPSQIIENQSLEVEATSGATLTSNGIIVAVANALKTAGVDLSTYDFSEDLIAEETNFELDMNAMPKKAEKTGSIVVTDVKGREVEINLPVSTYAISTMDVIDFTTPILGEDAFNMLVGSGQDGGKGLNGYAKLYTPIIGEYMKHVGQISDHNAPFDLEMILAVDPDVIIVNSAMGAHKYALEVEEQLKNAGIPIVLIDVPGKKFETSVQNTLKLLGQIFEEEERAEEVASFIDDQYSIIASKNLAEKENKPTVYYEKSGYSEIFGSTNTSESGWGTVIDLAGGSNIADPILIGKASGKGGGNTLDPEYVIQEDPDFIILSGSGAGWMDNYEGSTPKIPKFDIVNRTGWENLKAVKNDNVYEMAHATSRSIFGFDAALKLASVFYPEDFKDVDIDSITNEFFEKYMLVDSDITNWMFRISEVK